jgi:hypothetical protein
VHRAKLRKCFQDQKVERALQIILRHDLPLDSDGKKERSESLP